MINIKKGYLIVSGDANVTRYYTELSEAKQDAESGEEIYEVTACFKVENEKKYISRSLKEVFGE